MAPNDINSPASTDDRLVFFFDKFPAMFTN
jgi:hypothetical protein